MIKRLLSVLLIAMALISCEQEDVTVTYRLDVKLNPATGEKMPETITVNAKNETNGQTYATTADANGAAVFETLSAGFYTVTASSEAFNAVQNIELFDDIQTTMTLIKGKLGKFVIKEVYYSGSTTPAQKGYYSDQFIEIHNNSADTLYADGLSITIHAWYGMSENPYAYMAADSMAIQLCYTVPGNGTDHPVAPGKSFIIAQDAINHQSDELGNPNSPVNLADAEFEFYSTRFTGKDVDHPAPNLIPNLFPFIGSDVTMHNRGGNALALVRIPGDVDDFLKNNMIDAMRAKIPNKWVEDAVEIMPVGKTFKRYDSTLDAGTVVLEAGAKSGLSIRRKVSHILSDGRLSEGRVIYMDTNNSSNDFLHDVTPMPRGHE
ncbi:DUF4876 domain-containing protein [Marinilabiliaceae bacterium JC017]|nr:DUF4876 domain-containing protein [Marinilabiliaceae bacterium JC017]